MAKQVICCMSIGILDGSYRRIFLFLMYFVALRTLSREAKRKKRARVGFHGWPLSIYLIWWTEHPMFVCRNIV
jgi:hypothetical protein